MVKTFSHTGQPVPFLANEGDLLLLVVETYLEALHREDEAPSPGSGRVDRVVSRTGG
jgi:hypothetical protein